MGARGLGLLCVWVAAASASAGEQYDRRLQRPCSGTCPTEIQDDTTFRSSSLLQLKTLGNDASPQTDSHAANDAASRSRAAEGDAKAGSSDLSHAQVAEELAGATRSAQAAWHDGATLAQTAAEAAATAKGLATGGAAAQALQDAALVETARVADGLTGALQRVQEAGDSESRELGAQLEAAQYLKGAVASALEIERHEDENLASQAKAATLLQAAVQDLPPAAPGGDRGAMKELRAKLQEALDAQAEVVTDHAKQTQASHYLQQTVEGAASAVESLKKTAATETNDELREATRELRDLQASWQGLEQRELQMGMRLENFSKEAAAVEHAAANTSAELVDHTSKLQALAGKVQHAQKGENQQERSMERALDEAMDKYIAAEKARRAEVQRGDRLAHLAQQAQYLQKTMEGAATAAESLTRNSESQTSEWLKDASQELHEMEDSWQAMRHKQAKMDQSLESLSQTLQKQLTADRSRQAEAAQVAQMARFAQQAMLFSKEKESLEAPRRPSGSSHEDEAPRRPSGSSHEDEAVFFSKEKEGLEAAQRSYAPRHDDEAMLFSREQEGLEAARRPYMPLGAEEVDEPRRFFESD